MKKEFSQRAKGITLLFSMVYFASYILRKNFSVMLAAITAAGFDPIELGIVGSALTVSYGAGQIVCGFIGDRANPRYMIGSGMVIAVLCNVAMSFCSTVPLMAAVWFINGFAHAMLWPPMIRLMTVYMNDAEYARASVWIYNAASIATIVLYLLSPLLLGAFEWNRVIFFFSILGALIAVIWFVFSPRVLSAGPAGEVKEVGSSAKDEKRLPLPLAVILPTVLIYLAIILQGALRDGVGDWMPTFMSEAFAIPPESAIVAGVIPSLFNVMSTGAFGSLHQKLLKNEVSCAGVIFVGSLICAASLLLLNVLSASGWISAVLSAVLIGLIIACMHGINLMLISIVPKRFAKSGKVSTLSGILNSATYVGAAIALPLFPALKESYSWSVTIAVWCGIAFIGALACFAAFPMWQKFKRGYADEE